MVDSKFIINLKGKEFITFEGLLSIAHEKGLTSIDTEVLKYPHDSVTAVVKATVTVGSKTFSGIGDADKNSVNSMIAPHIIRMAECVPLNTEILTNNGWKKYDNVAKKDKLLCYDLNSDSLKWDDTYKINVFDKKDLVRIKGRSIDIKTTPDHKFVMTNQKGDKNLTPINEAKPSQRILLSAEIKENELETIKLTERESSLLGWLFTDGTIGKRVFISQSKVANLNIIRKLIQNDGYEYVGKPRSRTFPTGKTYDCLPGHKFYLKPEFARRLLKKINFEDYSKLPSLACKLDKNSRKNMIEAMLLGDGTKKRDTWAFGKKCKEGVMDFFEILCTLEGIPFGKRYYSSVGNVPLLTLRKNNKIATNYVKITKEKAENVFCPTTKYGTWIMKQNGNIMITGNTRAVARALRFALNIGMCSAEEMGGEVPKSPEYSSMACTSCGANITKAVKEYSLNNFKKVLCMDCQNKQK